MGILTAFRRIFRPEVATAPFAPRTVPFDSELTFRRVAFDTDADTVCRFQRETYETNFPGFIVDRAFLVGFRADLKRALFDPGHALFVLDRHHEPVAFLWLVTHENGWTGERSGYINNLFVAPSQRGRGLAKFLLEQTEVYYRQQGIYRIRLEVTGDNEVAVGLYRSRGYELSRFVMELSLDANPVPSSRSFPAERRSP